MMLCPKCGASLADDSCFCQECGAALDVADGAGEEPDSTRFIDDGLDFGSGLVQDALRNEPFGPAISDDGASGSSAKNTAADTMPVPIGSQGTASLDGSASGTEVMPSGAPPRRGDKKMVVIVVLVVIVVVLAVFVAVFAMSSRNGENASIGNQSSTVSSSTVDGSTQANASASSGNSSTASTDAPFVFETNDVRVEMPAHYADEGCTWSQGESSVTFAKDGDPAVEIVWGTAATKSGEAKMDSSIIGEISHGSIGLTVYMRVLRWDNRHRAIYSGAAEAGTPSLDVLGISQEAFVSWISLYTVRGFVPAAIQPAAGADTGAGTSASAGAGTVERTGSAAPFWGVWIGASKDSGEAESLARAAQAKGLPADVTQTTDWDNLNTEPWFVITVGRSSTQEEAESLLTQAKAAGYADAYVKYSGNHR